MRERRVISIIVINVYDERRLIHADTCIGFFRMIVHITSETQSEDGQCQRYLYSRDLCQHILAWSNAVKSVYERFICWSCCWTCRCFLLSILNFLLFCSNVICSDLFIHIHFTWRYKWQNEICANITTVILEKSLVDWLYYLLLVCVWKSVKSMSITARQGEKTNKHKFE